MTGGHGWESIIKPFYTNEDIEEILNHKLLIKGSNVEPNKD